MSKNIIITILAVLLTLSAGYNIYEINLGPRTRDSFKEFSKKNKYGEWQRFCRVVYEITDLQEKTIVDGVEATNKKIFTGHQKSDTPCPSEYDIKTTTKKELLDSMQNSSDLGILEVIVQ
jgi:hypothetical protein